jgi:hypothetical protein
MEALRLESRKFTDVGSFMRLVKTMFKCFDCQEDEDLFEVSLLTGMQPAKMGAEDCTELMPHCIIKQGFVPSSFMQLPAAKDVSRDQVYALMQLCMHSLTPCSPDPYSDCDEEADAERSAAPQAAADLVQLPAARQLSARQIADILQLSMHQETTPDGLRDVLSAMLALPAAQQISADVAEGLLSAAVERNSMQAVKVLCRYLPACAAAWHRMDAQLLLQRLEALLQETAPNQAQEQCQLRALLQHPSLQHKAQQVLPQLLLAGFACGRKQHANTLWWFGRDPLTTGELHKLLQLPAAQTLSAAVLRQLMQLSISQLDGVLLPVLVRLPAAAQLQQADVVLLLQAALGHTRSNDSSSLNTAGKHATTAAAAPGALTAAQLGGQQEAPHQQQQSQGQLRWQQQLGQQQQGQQQQEEQGQQQQELACKAHGSAEDSHCTSLAGLIQQCLQHRKAAPHLFQLLTLPWVQELPTGVLRDLLVAACCMLLDSSTKGLRSSVQMHMCWCA